MTPSRSVTATHDRVRKHLVRRAYLAGVLWSVAAVALVLALAWVAAGANGWRPGSLGPLVLDLLGLGLVVAVVVAVQRAVRRWLGARAVASAMDRAAGLPSGAVLSSLELAESLPGGVSPALASRAQRTVAARLDGDERRLAGPLGAQTGVRLRRGALGLVALTLGVTVLGFVAPERSRLAWAGLSRPIGVLSVPALPPLVVRPGSVELLRGSALDVTVEAVGRPNVMVSWRSAGQLVEDKRADVVDGVARTTLPAVSSPVQYWVTAPDGARSETFEVTPVDPLFVSDLTLSLTFPAHTRRIPEEYRGDVPPLRVPVGTRIELEGRASRPLGSAVLRHETGELDVPLSVADERFEHAWYPRRSGSYAWEFLDEGGAAAESAPLPLVLSLVPDSVPSVALVLPGVDTTLALSMKQPLAIQVADDYGISHIELVAYRVDAFGERGEPVVNRLDLGGINAALARPILDVSEWGLLPGDTIRYLARAVDNAPNPQVATTREFVLRMPGATELDRDAQRRLEEATEQLEELAREAARVNEEARELERQANAREGQEQGDPGQADEARAGFQEREQFRQALEEQEALAGDVDSLQAELQELAESAEDSGMDPELQKDLEELQQLLEELMTDDARERMQELADSLENVSREQIDQALEELTAEQEAFRERLEASLEQFRRAAVEQDFRATTNEAEELAQQEGALADAMEEGTDPELRADQQEELAQRADDLQERMETLEERLERLGEEEARQQVQEARQQAQQSQQGMEQAAQQTRSGDTQRGSQQAQASAQQMEQAANQLSQAQQQMAQQMAEQRREAFEQAASDALALSRQQAEIRESMRGAAPEAMGELRGDQAAVAQGIRNMAENLSESSGGEGGDADRQVMQRMGEAMNAARRTLEAMEDQRNGAPSPRAASEETMKALNQVALMAMAAGGQGGEGEGSGDAQQQMSDALESLAQQQGSIMNQTGALVPMQLGQEAQQRQLEEISQGQEQVADELGELSQDPSSEGDALGDLEALAEEAEALAAMLAQGRLDPETLQRQERLFHRLLDAGRTLERDEQSDERESETAGEVDRVTVSPLTLEALDAFRYTLPDGELLNRLPPAQRQLVIDYFERLNRERPRSVGSGRANR
jgi:hypothetical protein